MSRLANIEADYALFASLPETAQEELKVTLDEIAKEVLVIQEATVPVLTGQLKAALTIEEQLERLRVRIGLPQLKGRSKLFYAVVVEKGRTAGSKWVQRRRRVSGKLRLQRGRKRLEDVQAAYVARWTALAPRPFVHIESRVDDAVNAKIYGFWDRVFNRSAAA